jgi:hypothetical protein
VIPVYDNYIDYVPPRYARSTIIKLLRQLPERYLSGLQSVVLTNAKALGKGKTQRVRGRKHRLQRCRGFYHPVRKGQPAWIEIVVDNVIAAQGAGSLHCFAMRLSIARNLTFAEILFHEVGHHLDETIGSPARSGEAAAEAWSLRLTASYFRRHYWYLMPIVRLAQVLERTAVRMRKAVRRAPAIKR